MNKLGNIAAGMLFLTTVGIMGYSTYDQNKKKPLKEIYKEQADIRSDLESTLPADEFKSLEKRIGQPAPKKKIATILGLDIYSPIKRNVDFKYYQDSIDESNKIWQDAFQAEPSLKEELKQAMKDLRKTLKLVKL